ncbi:MAG: D-arginine dehydrogenase [Saprospiraceae bacterium]|jgi:D-arginine dehydrogenase
MFDIIVIGAGIAGVSAAAELAADARVLLLEIEARPGMHATGRSAAYYAPTYGNDVVQNLTAASESFFREPPMGFAQNPLIRPRDALFVGTSDQAESMAGMQAESPSLTAIDAVALTRRVPIFKPGILTQGLVDPVGGDLDVDVILQGYLRLFQQRGGELRTRSGVKSLRYQSGLWHLGLGDFEVSAAKVVNAAGAWADQVAALGAVRPLGLVPKRRTAILLKAPPGVDITVWPLVIDVDEQFYFKPDAGQILLSPADETPSVPCDAQPDEVDIAVAMDRFLRVVDLDVQSISHRWAGLRTFAPDKTFVVGFDPQAKGFFWLAGQGGYGVQSAPGVAQLARHLLLQTPLPLGYERLQESIEAVSPARLMT